MNVSVVAKRVAKLLQENSPTILTAVGVSGTLTTAYLAAKASFKASRAIQVAQAIENQQEKSHPLTKKEQARVVWKMYIPTGLSAATTIGCIIMSNRIGLKRTAAAYSLLTIAETSISEYKDKVVETIGPKKEQAIKDAVAQARVDKTEDKQSAIVIASGKVLCFEEYTGRYFECDMETLRRAENTINAQLLQHNEANMNDFYNLVGLLPTSMSSCTGWTIDKQMRLMISTVLARNAGPGIDGRPCITFEYNYVKPL